MAINPRDKNSYDALAHAYGALGKMDKVAQYGLRALQLRDEQYGAESQPLANLPDLPPAPSAETKGNNIISFSLFGGLAKYCETAVLNAAAAPEVYPHWTCRFYVDSHVPEHVITRLQALGAEVVTMTDSPIAPTLWRFLALDDKNCHRAIFRDADALINATEVSAVAAWVSSDRYFHMMRDASSHTELILAGMWGAVGGALTTQNTMQAQIEQYLQSVSLDSLHFADQFFLRETQWRVVKTSLIQHDGLFGFLGAEDFSYRDLPDKWHVGGDIALSQVQISTQHPDGEQVTWALYDKENKVSYPYLAVVQAGKICAQLPREIILKIDEGAWQAIILKSS